MGYQTRSNGAVLVLTTFFLFFAVDPGLCQEEKKAMILARYEKMSSKILGDEFRYLVLLPSGYEKADDKYPVIYVMNAHMVSTFANAVATLNQLSFEAIPQMILVGLCNDRGRARNYFPVRPDNKPGGADTFLAFLTNELIPHIDSNYRTEKYRILAGQSNTGLFTLYALLVKPELFNAYIAVSPTLGWCLEFMTDKARNALSQGTLSNRFLYLSYGGRDYSDLVIEPVKDLREMFDECAPVEFDWNFEVLENDVHVPIPSLNDGLLSLFPDYLASDDLRKQGLVAVDRHYKNLTRRYGFRIDAPEEVLFNMGFDLKQGKKSQEAITMFQTLLERFPYSVRGTFFLAETYKEMGDIHSAKMMYRKTLELDPEFDAAKRRLEEVK